MRKFIKTISTVALAAALSITVVTAIAAIHQVQEGMAIRGPCMAVFSLMPCPRVDGQKSQ